jgi:glycosyltransferase involved in cell wall biosynthesis
MKIAMLMSVYGERAVGGAERTAAQMAKLLVQRGHSVHLLSLAPKGESAPPLKSVEGVICESIPLSQWYDPYGKQDSVTRSALPLRFTRLYTKILKVFWHIRDIYNPTMVSSVSEKLIQIQPDILFTHTLQGFSVGVWAAAKALNIKVVHMTHDHALICPGTAMTRGSGVCERVCSSCSTFSLARRAIAVNPDAIVGPSQVVLDRHRKFGWFRNVKLQRVIPNTLPLTWQHIDASAIKKTARYTINRPLNLGFMGRIDESKGADTLIIALTLLPAALLGRWTLSVAGQGSMAQLEEWVLAKKNGANNWALISPYVECIGVVKADDYFKKLDVLVTPSRAHETFCNVVMEAASLGCPAIVSDKGALPERVEGGLAGWIFPAGDASSLATQIETLFERPFEIAEKAIKAFSTSSVYSPNLQIDSIERLLVDVLND